MVLDKLLQRVGGLRPIVGDGFLPLSASELADVEELIGTTLPDTYRAFLLCYGASAFRRLVQFRSIVPLPPHISRNGTDYIDALYGMEPETYNLKKSIRIFKGRMPGSVIPIGSNGGGNQICLGVSGEERGKVFYWDRHNEFDEEEYLEDHEPPVPPELLHQNVHLVADSFEDFLQRLEIDPDE